MTKVRVTLFLITLVVVGVFGVFASYYARGYRFSLKTFKFSPSGILVVKSEPDGASIFVNHELKGATNTNISLAPGVYDVEVKRDGYFGWYKRLTIEKEVVTLATISLFKNAPSLSPVTFAGAVNPVISDDGTKIAFSVLPATGVANEKVGLWALDTFSLPLGFGGGPKRIADGNMTGATYAFSPDARQLLLTVSNGIFLIDSASYTGQNERVNIAFKKDEIIMSWEKERNAKNQGLMANLPPEVADILTRKTSDFLFSPDSQMILYTASSSAAIPDNLIPPLPGASTQKQERNIISGRTYIYDIKEDRNFFIMDQPVQIRSFDKLQTDQVSSALYWLSGGKYLLFSQPNQIVVMDDDGTNRQVVYSGSYVAPFALPFTNASKILVLTNLGSANSVPNLYTLTVK
jgi:hypothetical protein